MKLRLLAVAMSAILTACGGSGGSGNGGDEPTPPTNNPPEFSGASASALNGAVIDVDLAAQASDADGDSLSIESVGEVAHGDVTFSGLILSYDPQDGFAGTDSVEVTVTDGTDSVTGTVTFTVKQGLSLSGRVVDEPIPNAKVIVEIGGESFEATADADGFYTLDIETSDLDSYIKVIATGAEEDETAKGVKLVSLLGEIGSVLAAAGDDRTLGGENDNAANVTNVTTARYVLAVEANGGEEIVSDEEMETAEKSIDADKLLEIAAVIKIVLDNPEYDLPEGSESVLDLVTDTEAYNSFVAEVTSEDPENNALTEAMEQVVNDPALVQAYTKDNLASVYYLSYAAAPGFLSRGGDMYQFNENNTGLVANEQGTTEFIWSITNGYVSVVFDQPLETFSYHAVEAVLDAEMAEQWIQTTNSAQIGVTIREKNIRFTRLVDGAIIDTVNTDSVYDYIYDDAGTGIDIPDVLDQTGSGQVQLRDANASEALPIVAADLQETWAVNSYYTYTGSSYNGPVATLGYATDLFDFVEGGNGLAQISGRTFNWNLQDNVVTLDFNDQTSLEVKKLDGVGELSAFALSTFDANGALMAFSYNFGTWQDPAAALTAENVVTEEGFHWTTFVNGWIADYWQDGVFDVVAGSGFGWEFKQDGSSNNLSFWYDSYDEDGDGNTEEVMQRHAAGNWSIGNDGVLSFSRYCQEGSCRRREWLGLQAGDDEIVVVEREAFAADNSLIIAPRVNIYRLWENPSVEPAVAPASFRVVAYPTE